MAGSDAPFESFLQDLSKATNETQKRELFIGLAKSGFADTDLATELALGAEYKVRFTSAGIIRRGAVDAFYGNLIIEFEHDLGKTGDHALEQLKAYVAGAWTEDKSAARPYLAVATDGKRWQIFAPQLPPGSTIAPENVVLGEAIETWEPTGKEDGSSLREFLNRLFFRKTLLKPTASNFAQDFGLSSPAFVRARQGLLQKISELGGDPQLGVLQKAWKASLQIAYGSVDTDDELFAKHTYLAVLARLLVWTAFEHRSLKAAEIEHVLSGLYFRDKNIANLVEDDFFRWYGIPSKTDAAHIWVGLTKQLVGYDLAAVKEDILKPLYEELVDPETKHELGEFYTPDWLATRVVERLLQDHDWKKESPALLDPACGSGTFLRAAIDLIRTKRKSLSPEKLVAEILSHVMGIDVHPLAVIIARSTYLLATKDLVAVVKGPITLPVFLANALNMPPLKRQKTLTEEIVLEVDGTPYPVPIDFVYHGADYDYGIEEVLSVARAYGKSGSSLDEAADSLKARIGSSLDQYGADLVLTLGKMAKHIAKLIRERKNSVHGFLLKNHYRPSMLRHSFDYVMGNPPWLTVGRIETPQYKDAVIKLNADTNIAPRSRGDQSHTNIALLFVSAAVGNFLKPGEAPHARVGFVMPHTLFTAKHNRNLREATYDQRFDVVELWDLHEVTPLFNIPACVIFLAADALPKPHDPKPGVTFSGKLPQKDVPASVAKGYLSTGDVEFELLFLAKRSSWVIKGISTKGKKVASKSENAYQGDFRQGAILYPQTLVVVTPVNPVTSRSGSVRVVTNPDAIATAHKETAEVNHIVDNVNLLSTAAADHILPYALTKAVWTVVLPTAVDPGQAGFAPVAADVLRKVGRVNTADWLEWADEQWKKVRKKGEKSSLGPRLDTYGHLSANEIQRRYLVLYTAAGKRAMATVIDTKGRLLPFVARDRTYWASFDSANEAYYVAGFLNSAYVADIITDWMNRGLLGPRDINKRVLDVRWPRFDPAITQHQELSDAAALLSNDAAKALKDMPEAGAGIQRRWMRENLSQIVLKDVEKLAKKISEKS